MKVLHIVGDPTEHSLQEAAAMGRLDILEKILASRLGDPAGFSSDGRFMYRRHLVATIGAVRVEVRADEHAPPHFHVRSRSGLNGSYTIRDCARLNGNLLPAQEKELRRWYLHAKPLVVEKWNATRPAGCEVGRYREE